MHTKSQSIFQTDGPISITLGGPLSAKKVQSPFLYGFSIRRFACSTMPMRTPSMNSAPLTTQKTQKTQNPQNPRRQLKRCRRHITHKFHGEEDNAEDADYTGFTKGTDFIKSTEFIESVEFTEIILFISILK